MTLKKIDHTFKHQQLSYDAKSNYQPYIRLSFFFSKLPNVSYEQFHRHWETVHADVTVASKAFKECHVGRYVQVSPLSSDQGYRTPQLNTFPVPSNTRPKGKSEGIGSGSARIRWML